MISSNTIYDFCIKDVITIYDFCIKDVTGANYEWVITPAKLGFPMPLPVSHIRVSSVLILLTGIIQAKITDAIGAANARHVRMTSEGNITFTITGSEVAISRVRD